MTPDTTPSSHWLPSTISMPRLDDDAVIQIHDFIHAVRDVDDRQAAPAQFTHDLEQAGCLALGKRRGRLVHDNDPGLAHQCLEQLGNLALSRCQAGNERFRLNLQTVLLA